MKPAFSLIRGLCNKIDFTTNLFSNFNTPTALSLKRISGQSYAKAQISAWLRGHCLPPTILITGNEGVGKRELAIELARAINCQRQQEDACDECPSCIKITSLSHRDVHVLLPLTSEGNRSDDAAMATMRNAVSQYMEENTSLVRSRSNIPRDHIRRLHREMVYAPAEGKRRIAIIFEADCMSTAGANSLLKILEEPPVHAIFIMVSANPERLLPTVLSRCQRLDLRPLKTVELMNRLLERGVEKNRAKLAARMGAGSVHRSDSFIHNTEQFNELRNQVEHFLASGFAQDDSVYWSTLENLGTRNDRGQLEDFLEVCGVYLRDLFLLLEGREANVTNIDRVQWLKSQIPFLDSDLIENSGEVLDLSYADLFRNGNAQLLLVKLWQSLHSCKRRLD